MSEVTVPSTITFESIRVPNFIIINDGKVHSRQDGMVERPKRAVQDLSYEEAHALAEQWRKDFLAKAGHGPVQA